jgi:hypothetical protein
MGETVEARARAMARAWNRGQSARCDEEAREVVARAAYLVARRSGLEDSRDFLDALMWGRGDRVWLPGHRDRQRLAEGAFGVVVVAVALIVVALCVADLARDLEAAQAQEVAP